MCLLTHLPCLFTKGRRRGEGERDHCVPWEPRQTHLDHRGASHCTVGTGDMHVYTVYTHSAGAFNTGFSLRVKLFPLFVQTALQDTAWNRRDTQVSFIIDVFLSSHTHTVTHSGTLDSTSWGESWGSCSGRHIVLPLQLPHLPVKTRKQLKQWFIYYCLSKFPTPYSQQHPCPVLGYVHQWIFCRIPLIPVLEKLVSRLLSGLNPVSVM